MIFYFRVILILLNYVVGWQSLSYLTGLLQYLAKNMALLVQKLFEEKSCQYPFLAILSMTWTLVEELFCSFPNKIVHNLGLRVFDVLMHY